VLSASRICHTIPRETVPKYSLYRRLGGPQSQCGHHGEERTLLPLLGVETRLLDCPALFILSDLKVHKLVEKLLYSFGMGSHTHDTINRIICME
jgi:hypothetical protein